MKQSGSFSTKSRVRLLPGVRLLACVCALWTSAVVGAPAAVLPPPVELRVEWAGQVPRFHVTLRAAQVPEAMRELTVPLSLTDVADRQIWSGNVKVTVDDAGIGSGQIDARLPDKPAPPYRVSLRVNDPAWGIDVSEQIAFASPREVLRYHGLRTIGSYPDARVELVMALSQSDQFMKADVTVRDRERNQILRKTERYPPTAGTLPERIDITPPSRAVGPFTVEYQVANETESVTTRFEQRFAYANTVLPLTSMQSDRLIDWYRSDDLTPDSFGKGGNYTSTPFNSQARIEPAVFDDAVFHSGGRSLRLAYRPGGATHIYSNLELPGFPIRATLWVKGNNSDDRLIVTLRDRCELSRAPWERRVNKDRPVVCTLNFEGWRKFEVAVLGQGLQGESRHEVKDALVTPIYLFAFSVEAGASKAGETGERVVWIDDLALETQVHVSDRVSLELRGDTPDARLHPDGKIVVAIGNGSPAKLTDGRLQITARDRIGNDVFEASEAVEADALAFAFIEIPMTRLAAAQPDGPVVVDVTFTAPSAGLRAHRSWVLKASKHAGIIWDFEDRQRYNGRAAGMDPKSRQPLPSAGGVSVVGGAEGSGHALAITVPTNDLNEVILHPALPGIPTRIEMRVRGGPVPVLLRPQFFDAGRIGVHDMVFNRLLTPEIRVDWQEWRRVSFNAPAIPEGYNDPDKQFIFEATYPLNLVLSARVSGSAPGEIWVDRITVQTHLDEADAVTAFPVYADEHEIIHPGDPLTLGIENFNRGVFKQTVEIRLSDIHGQPVLTRSRVYEIPPGQVLYDTLMPSLARGVYDLDVTAAGVKPLRERVMAVDFTEYFGDTPDTMLQDVSALERNIGMGVRRIYLDWDNLELAPGMFHFTWFDNEIKKASEDGRYRVVPILGFSADWAGPEKWAAVQQKAYERFIGNHLQVPVRLTDWSLYVREAVRAYAGKVSAWEFWENPDDRSSPRYIAPARYSNMLDIVRMWVDLYDQETPVIAGGFSYDNMYDYLRAIPQPYALPFDRIGVQFNIGELSPEGADMEGLFDDLDAVLKLRETGRGLDVPQIDWAVGERVTPLQQAAYHSRVALIMNRRLRESYRLKLVNDGETFAGYGIFYRRPYGNTPNVQGLRPHYVPKPAYFTLATTRRILEQNRFVNAIRIPDRDAVATYAYLYESAGGGWMAAVWRARGGSRAYRVPAGWAGAVVRDAFGTETALQETLRLGPVPLFVTFPADSTRGQIQHDLRMLDPVDGRDRRILALMTADPDSADRAAYRATGASESVVRRDRRIIGGEPVEYAFRTGLSEESFAFTADQPGAFRLTRIWLCETGQAGFKMTVSLNDGPGKPWDLTLSETGETLKQYGVRESSLFLPEVRSGVNRITIRHLDPGATASWTVSPLPDGPIDLAYWDPLNAAQAKGFPLQAYSARGTPLRIGERTFETGIGTLAPSYLEFPLQQRFERFEVTVGIDAVGRGRGNVVFSIFGDGQLLATSGPMTGFMPPQTLKVETMGSVSRLALRAINEKGEDSEGFADWVDARLYPKARSPKAIE